MTITSTVRTGQLPHVSVEELKQQRGLVESLRLDYKRQGEAEWIERHRAEYSRRLSILNAELEARESEHARSRERVLDADKRLESLDAAIKLASSKGDVKRLSGLVEQAKELAAQLKRAGMSIEEALGKEGA